jgi:type VI secretion system protein ImpK
MSTFDHSILKGLPDLCAEVLAFAAQLRRAKDPGSADALKRRVAALFGELERKAQAADIAVHDVQLARYALAALIDEVVLNSNWKIREAWTSRPLQLEYFNEFTAGEGFYTKLESLRGSKDPAKLDVIEVFALCLGLGFRGRHAGVAGMETLKVLKRQLAEELRAARNQTSANLSSQWEGGEQLEVKVKTVPVWVVAAVGGGLVLALFLLLDLTLNWLGGDVANVPS